MATFCGYLIVLFAIQQSHFITCEEQGEHDEQHWVVHTSTGPVEGEVISPLNDMQVYAFYGIPYAKPPVGELRFKPPEPIQPWTDVLKTNKKPVPCYQHLHRAKMFRVTYDDKKVFRPWSEDCLNLNIWIPKPKVADAPVLVVIHPGVFEFGSNMYPDGSVLSGKTNDILVTMNYRLGPFGFLNLGVPDAPGNMGLLDQQLALKWVHENIHHFGGLNKAIILVGAGDAGGASVGFHVLAPGSREYFTTVVPISGSPTCSWAFQERETAIRNSKTLSERLLCSKRAEEELDCLRNANPEDIIDTYISYSRWTALQLKPTVDGTFITEPPVEALKNGNFKKVISLTISGQQEGSLALATVNPDHMPRPEEGLKQENIRKTVMRIAPGLTKAGLSAIDELYFDQCHVNDSQETRDAAIGLYSDVLFDCCMNQFNELFAENGGVLFYCVENINFDSIPAWVGAYHAIAVEFAFGYPFIVDDYTKADRELSEGFIAWINEHTRKKAVDIQKDLVQFDVKDKNYTVWSLQGPAHFSHYRENECRLWNEIIPKLKSSQLCSHA